MQIMILYAISDARKNDMEITASKSYNVLWRIVGKAVWMEDRAGNTKYTTSDAQQTHRAARESKEGEQKLSSMKMYNK